MIVIDTFNEICEKIVSDLQTKLKEQGKVATGKTLKSLRYETNDLGFKIFGAGYFEFVEFGRGASKSKQKTNFYESLLEWARAVGFPEGKVRFLQYYINKYGTKLYREKKTAGVLTAVINDNLIDYIKTKILLAEVANYNSEIKRLFI